MGARYKIHPGIGIARLGNSPDQFCISPEAPAALPIACDERGNPLLAPDGKSELTVAEFKDQQGRIKRQAARFQVYVYDEEHPEGRPLKLGDKIEGGGNDGILVDIQWRVYLANKKASWYEFQQLQGEHGYAPGHPRRNANITDPEARQRLIIDPGPRTVNHKDRRTAEFSRDGSDVYATTFPPQLQPHSIDTLGELKTDDVGRLLVLGGYGNSGSFNFDEFGQPRISNYANNDGWFDDTSDGPVMARLVMYSPLVSQLRFVDVEYPAWAVVGYPRYVPQILDMVTMDDVLYDRAIRDFAHRTDLYGEPGTFDDPPQIPPTDTKALLHWAAGTREWNPAYKPWFYRDVWPILFRPDEFTYLTNVLAQSNYPHNQSERGNFNPYKLGQPPVVNRRAVAVYEQDCVATNHSGELLLERLDPFLTTVDTEAVAALRNALAKFAKNLGWSSESDASCDQGQEGRQLYQSWLGSVQESCNHLMGNLLFDEFRTALKGLAGNFAQSLHRAEATDDLARYTRKWKTVGGAATEAYQTEKAKLGDRLDQLLEKLQTEGLCRWKEALRVDQSLSASVGPRLESALEELEGFGNNLFHDYIVERLRPQARKCLDEFRAGRLLEECQRECWRKCTYDPFRSERQFLYRLLRLPGEENEFRLAGKPQNRTYNLPLMPLLNGDNPISNTLPSKFLRLTDYQLFILRQWAQGLFYNEELEGWSTHDPFNPYADWVNKTGADLDRGVLSNLLGGAFCPGGEVGWVMRNPSVYLEPYRVKADPDFYTFRQTAAQACYQRGGVGDDEYISYVGITLSQDNDFNRGLQPGDFTKYMALPWQADFNECTTQDVNVTYEQWNRTYAGSDDDSLMKREEEVWETLWWPAHRPLQVFELTSMSDGQPNFQFLNWARGIPQTNAGDQKMVTAWSSLGFVILNPFMKPEDARKPSTMPPTQKYVSVDRNYRENA